MRAIPELFIGALLTIAIFLVGLVSTGEVVSALPKGSWLTKDAAGFFTFLLVVIGGAQLLLFYWQLHYMRRGIDNAAAAARAARDSAVAAAEANRPWVSIKEVRFTKSLRIAPAGILGTVEIKIENVGRSPATGVTIWVQFISLESGDIRRVQELVKSEAYRRSEGLLSGVLFPTQVIPQHHSFSIANSEIERTKLKKDGEPDRVPLWLGVCVCYRVSDAAEIKHTSRIFGLGWVPLNVEDFPSENLNLWLGGSNWDSAD